jgi:hypothetical protein
MSKDSLRSVISEVLGEQLVQFSLSLSSRDQVSRYKLKVLDSMLHMSAQSMTSGRLNDPDKLLVPRLAVNREEEELMREHVVSLKEIFLSQISILVLIADEHRPILFKPLL